MPNRLAGFALAAALLLALAAPLAAQSAADAGQSPLAPGDIVRLRFVQEPELSGDFPVDEGGRVSLPLLGFRDVTRYPADYLKRQLVAD
ncbi:MAG: polysaccharide biosynthesis/export family protein, partial [Gemmatimonadota bacterium]